MELAVILIIPLGVNILHSRFIRSLVFILTVTHVTRIEFITFLMKNYSHARFFSSGFFYELFCYRKKSVEYNG